MSYDLAVFEISKAPTTKEAFMEWYSTQADEEEEHDYYSIAVASPKLRNWFMEMKETFPPMNGKGAPSNEMISADGDLEDHLTDYCIGRDMIYACFAWSLCDKAYEFVRELAERHDVGFFDVSGYGDVILPDGSMIE